MGHSSKDTEKKSLNNVQKNELKTENRLSKLEKDGEIKDVRNLFRLYKKNKWKKKKPTQLKIKEIFLD